MIKWLVNINRYILGVVSLNIPLQKTNQSFDCSKLQELAIKKVKLSSLREMVDESIITDDQYTKAVQNLFSDLLFDKSVQNVDSLIESSVNAIKLKKSGGVTIGEWPSPKWNILIQDALIT